MISLEELASHLDELLECGEFSDYCSNGLQVEGVSEVKSIATAVTASLEAIEKAVELGVDALIVHHGMFWKGDDYNIIGPKKRKLQALLSNGISLLAYHLPLDAHRQLGNNWKAAADLGWTDLKPFGEMNGRCIGVSGRVPNVSRDDFQASLERYYDHPAHSAKGGAKKVETAALISGGAYRSIPDAAKEKIDCFVSGNFDEPAWHLAFELGVNFYALGHFATERIGPKALGEHLADTFGLEWQFIDQRNPF